MDSHVPLSSYIWDLLRVNLHKWTGFYDQPRHRPPQYKAMENHEIRKRLYGAITATQMEIDNRPHTEGESVAPEEFLHIVQTVIAALLNPFYTEWDVSRYADRVKQSRPNRGGEVMSNDINLANYFKPADIGDIDVPATVLDRHHKIIAWHLPSIICRHRTDDYNNAVLGLEKLLKKSMQKNLASPSWRGSGFIDIESDPLFHPGTVNISPGWFMQRQQRLEDDFLPSCDLRTPEGAQFTQSITQGELLLDAIFCLTARDTFTKSQEAIRQLKGGALGERFHPNVDLWPSSFSGLQVIVNRITPPHRDSGGAPADYDLLLSVGTHSRARFYMKDIQAGFSYAPGTAILVCGRVLLHQVSGWDGGERICLAHYIRDMVHDRLGLARSTWVSLEHYSSLMSPGYRSRQNLP